MDQVAQLQWQRSQTSIQETFQLFLVSLNFSGMCMFGRGVGPGGVDLNLVLSPDLHGDKE